MARFVKDVNLDHVASARQYKNEREVWTTSLSDRNGKKLGECSIDNLEEFTAPVIPAAPGTTATIICVWDDDSRPTESEVEVYKRFVVGWRIYGGSADPILTETLMDIEHCWVEQPDGRLSNGDGARSLAAAKADELNWAQHSWDLKHPKKSEK